LEIIKPKDQKEKLNTWLNYSKDALAYIPAAAAFIYILGFMVANGHYMKCGVTNLSLFEAKYISAGLLYAASIGLIIVLLTENLSVLIT